MFNCLQDCNWGCRYNSKGICENCNESILKYRDQWIKLLGKKLFNYNYVYDYNSEEHKKLESDYKNNLISISQYLKIREDKHYIVVNPSTVSTLGCLEELGPWQKDPDASHCWLRTIKNGDPNNIRDRRVFVEKTPRVFDPSLNIDIEICHSWIQGTKGSYCEGDEYDVYARYWSNVTAVFLGI